VKVVVITGAGGNFCSGGDVHEIIGPLTKMDEAACSIHAHDRRSGPAMRACPQPIIAAVEGVCAGAGAILAMASDIRFRAPNAKTPSCSPASACRARTWAPARSCRGSSATAAPRSCCSPAAT
jgi:1,4-dihydroxy-2-naphthoyl-CoA synthase